MIEEALEKWVFPRKMWLSSRRISTLFTLIDGLFYEKWRVVLCKVTGRFEKVTACFSSTDGLFYLLWTILIEEKRRGDVIAVTLVTAKKVKSCGVRARVRERKTPTHCFVFDTVLSNPKEGSPLASSKATKTSKSRLLLFCKLCFSELRLSPAKTSLFRHFFPLCCNISPYTYREMFRNLVMKRAYQANDELCEY